MPQIFSTSRAEAALFRFPPLFYPLIVVAALVLQAYLPIVVHAAVYLDLPLLAVVYWAITTRNPVSASILGMVVGLAQDSLAHLSLGLNGIAKTLIGYVNASFGAKLDADHAGIRMVAVFGCYVFNRAILYAFSRFLLATPLPWRGGGTMIAAAVNAALALVVFRGLDGFRRWV